MQKKITLKKIFSIIMLRLVTVCLLKPGPSRQSKPIRWQNWNWIWTKSNPAQQMSGAIVMLTRLWCYLQEKYTCICCTLISVEWLIGLENTWKQKLLESVTCKIYISSRVCGPVLSSDWFLFPGFSKCSVDIHQV